MNGNSSLVSGFDSSTENQVHFKRLPDNFFVAPFLVKINLVACFCPLSMRVLAVSAPRF
jgi:hypothetical protein